MRTLVGLALLGLLGACSSEAPESTGELEAELRVEDQYVVVLSTGVSADGVVTSSGLDRRRVRHRYQHALRGFSARLSGAERGRLLARSDVAYVERDFAVQAVAEVQPGIARVGATLNPIARIDGIDQRVDTDIAVIDSGIDLDHPDLNVFRQQNFLDPSRSADDDNGHGTHVAGIAAAVDNGSGVVGVAPGARLWALKALDTAGNGTLSSVLAAIDYVTAHASEIEVVNMSLGGWGLSVAQHDAIQRSVAAGVVYVVAAGNDGMDIFGPDGQPDVFPDFLPAALPQVMTVSATIETDGEPGGLGPATGHGPDDTLAPFSNFSSQNHPRNAVVSPGAKIDLAAPGTAVYSTLPGAYGFLSGTSMASPVVAGAAGLYVAAFGRAHDEAGVLAIRQALVNAGESQSEWRSGGSADPDSRPERLLRADRFSGSVRLFFDDFANGLGKWTESGEGDWNTEALHSQTGYPGSGSNSPAAHSDDCRTECTLTLAQPIDLRGLSGVALSVLRFVDVEVDTGEFVRIDAWNGANWQALREWGGGNGDDDRWHSEFVDLSEYAGVAEFRLRLVTKQNQTTEHVHLDDLQIVAASTPPPPAACGDQLCQEGENCTLCPADCGACPAVCGNGSCEAGETCSTCAPDCGVCPAVCGNGSCESGETCSNCVPDCGACPAVCGNGSCESGETCSSCVPDCGVCPAVCGNGSCESSETCANCASDCGACPAVCGNGSCELGETCSGCVADCGECTSFTTLFFDDFAGLTGWTETGEGDWNTEALHTKAAYPATGTGSPAAHSDDCRTECTLTLLSPIDLSVCGDARIELLRFLDDEIDTGEFLRIDAWDGTGWQPLAVWGGGSGDDNQWHAESISLASFIARNDFRIRLVTKQNQTTEHVHIDDLRIVGANCN